LPSSRPRLFGPPPYFHDLPCVLNGGRPTGRGEFACERPPDIFQKAGCCGCPNEREYSRPNSCEFYLQIDGLLSGGTRIRTGDTMIFGHTQKPLGMRQTRISRRISVHGVPLDTSWFCPYCCATVGTAFVTLTVSCSSIEPKGIVNVRRPIPKTCARANRIRRKQNAKGEGPYLFGVSFSSVKRYARMVASIVKNPWK
jgi:hypothetical protein